MRSRTAFGRCSLGVMLMISFSGCGPSAQEIATAKADLRNQSKQNMKKLGFAFHNYHDTEKSFPPGSTKSAEGKVGQNWAYSLLPYVDRFDVYNRINDHLPWDDAVNRGVYETEIEAYLSPGITERKHASGLALAHYAGNSQLMSVNSNFGLRNITDGSSNTLMLGEINENLPAWGHPDNVRDPVTGLNQPGGFGSPEGDGAYFVFADGSVQFIGNDVSSDVLKAFASPAGKDSSAGYQSPTDPAKPPLP